MHLRRVKWVPFTLCIYTLSQSCGHASSLVLPVGGVAFWTLPTSGLKQQCSSSSSSSLVGRPFAVHCYPATPSDSGVGGLEQQQPKLRRLDPDCFSRTILLRGGADASVAVGDENTHETINCRTDGTKDGLEDTTVGLGAESAAESEDADKRSKRWLLKATEHDR